MTTSEIFSGAETVSFPPDMIAHLVRLAAVRPELVQLLAAHPDFEMVPMPRTLVSAMRRRPDFGFGLDLFPGFGASSAFLERGGLTQPERSQPPPAEVPKATRRLRERALTTHVAELSAVTKAFIEAFEKGDAGAAMGHIAAGYQDRSGRKRDELQTALEKAIKSSQSRRAIVTGARDIDASENHVAATIDVAVDLDGRAGKVSLDILFEREQGKWKIAAIDPD